jgi:hypothetical protein
MPIDTSTTPARNRTLQGLLDEVTKLRTDVIAEAAPWLAEHGGGRDDQRLGNLAH